MNVPNFLSLVRIALVPVFAVVFFLPDPNARLWAALIYAAAFLTDIADGWIARHYNKITKLGRVLDPLADKLMTFTVIACITIKGIIPVWAVVIFACKELSMLIGGALMLHRTKDVIPSNWLGKASTGVFFVVCAVLVLFPIPSAWATGLMAGALALTVAALIRYAFGFRKVVKKAPEG